MKRKRISEMSMKELHDYERSENYRIGRVDAFDHGNPETILDYWESSAPDYDELCAIVRNLLKRVAP